jgi:hypothetical protein
MTWPGRVAAREGDGVVPTMLQLTRSMNELMIRIPEITFLS